MSFLSRNKYLFAGFFFVILVMCFCMVICLGPIILLQNTNPNTSIVSDSSYEYVSGNIDSENKILVIKIKGAILNEPEEGISSFLSSGAVYGFDIKDELVRAADDDSIKGVMLEVDSPGGTITGSNAIAEGVAYFKEKTEKPVYGYGYSLIASGGYWTIASSDKIFIDKGSLVGSIGVIMGPFKNYKNVITEDGITTKDGIDTFYITSGEGKDLGSSYRKMTDKEMSILKQGSQEAYSDFVNYVSERRGIEKTTIEKDIGGYIYGEQTALKLKLIDAIGNKADAYAGLAEKAGVSDDYQVVKTEIEVGSILDLLFSGETKVEAGSKVESSLCVYSLQPMAYMGETVDLCGSD